MQDASNSACTIFLFTLALVASQHSLPNQIVNAGHAGCLWGYGSSGSSSEEPGSWSPEFEARSSSHKHGILSAQDVGGLRTIRELQRGASGVIVLAEERDGATPVAVKLMPRDKAASPALQREMLTQRSCLSHPHVIQVRCGAAVCSMLHPCSGPRLVVQRCVNVCEGGNRTTA